MNDSIETILDEFTKRYSDIADLYNHIILFTKENYDELTCKELDTIDKFLLTHANSITTRRSIYKFVPRKEDDSKFNDFLTDIIKED